MEWVEEVPQMIIEASESVDDQAPVVRHGNGMSSHPLSWTPLYAPGQGIGIAHAAVLVQSGQV